MTTPTRLCLYPANCSQLPLTLCPLQGGLRAMGESMERGHVLVMSLWDDHSVNMLWLDR